MNIKELLSSAVQEGKTPSAQYFFFDRNSLLETSSVGLADIQQQTAAGPDTAYHLYSITKTFTALAVVQLAAAGKFSLHDPVVKFLPAFPYGAGITIDQLLSHAAGIPNPIPLSWIHTAAEHDSFNANDFFANIIARHPHAKSKPNQRFRYSNLGYVLLGQLIAAAAGTSYENYIGTQIIGKLNLPITSLGFSQPAGGSSAIGYHRARTFSAWLLGFFMDKRKFLGNAIDGWLPFHDFYVNGAAYGGLIGSANALVAYGQALLRPDTLLEGAIENSPLFRKNILSGGKASGMCRGWFTGSLNGTRYFTHAGGGGGFYCEIHLYPDIQRGSLVLFNRTGMRDERYLDQLDRYLV